MPTGSVGKAEAQDGCQLFYRMRSRPGKPRLVLVHSLALDHAIWNSVADELAENCAILLYDCRGHGQSDRRPGPYTVAQFTAALAALLNNADSTTKRQNCFNPEARLECRTRDAVNPTPYVAPV